MLAGSRGGPMRSIEEIERLRKVNRIFKKTLAARAGIDPSTYSAMLDPDRRRGSSIGNIERVDRALHEIISELPAARRQS